MKKIIPILATIMTVSTAASGGYKLVQEPLAADPMQVSVYELENGLTVYLTENHESPTFRAEVTVRAGSKNDPETATGLAHYLEHLLFKGNHRLGSTDWEKEKVHIEKIEDLYEEHFHEDNDEKRAEIYAKINEESQLASEYAIPNEIDKLYSSLGGTGINAYTHSDRTVYLVEMPSNRMEQWAEIESNRYNNPVFRLFQPELEIVYEEKNRSMDNKDNLVHEKIASLVYGEHPYGSQTALGSVEHLKRPSLKRIHEFFDAHYVANNMAVAISGSIDKEETIKIVEKYFSYLPSGKAPEFNRPLPVPLEENKSLEFSYLGEETVVVAFQTQALKGEDVEALKLADMIMDNASAGLINLNLNQKQLVAKAGCYPYFRNDAGAQYFWGVPKEGQSLEEVEALLLEQIELLKKGEFDDWIIPAIVTDFKKNEKQTLETNTGRLRMITTSFGAKIDWEQAIGEIDRIGKLNKEDVVRVANKYFSKPYAAVYRRDGEYSAPKVPKPEFDKIDIDRSRSSEFAESVLAKEAEPISPDFLEEGEDYQIIEVRDGVRLFYLKNPMNDLFRLTRVYEFGKEELKKLDLLAALLNKSGAADLNAEELKKAWYQNGAEFSFEPSDHLISLSVSGLEEKFDETIGLFAKKLSEANFEEPVLEELISIELKKREDRKKDFNTIFTALRNYHRHGENSPFLKGTSSDEYEATTVAEMNALLEKLNGFSHDYLYVGTLSVDRVKETLLNLVGNEVVLEAPIARSIAQYKEPEKDAIMYVNYPTAQAQLRIEFPDGEYDEALLDEVEVFNEYFYGGMSGIVFQELREARALAYSVWAYYLAPVYLGGQNLVMGNIGTQADKAVDALEAYLELWNAMPHSPKRYEEALASIDSKYRVSKIPFRDVLPTVKAWERLGLEGDPRENRYKRVLDHDLETLFEFYTARIKDQPKLISLLGPSESIDVERLKKMGAFTEVTVDELFVD
ncbi:insulinase family protein [Puniceicoccaceae bacterium K14]|nr:insulinase family protein [Puniceicoccaceae bacterium K14]